MRQNATALTGVTPPPRQNSDHDYPVSGAQIRPYQLWNPREQKRVRGRCYAILKNALDGALIETHWSQPGRVLELIDVRYGRLLAVYRRHEKSIEVQKHHVDVQRTFAKVAREHDKAAA
jgi:hypothetical protein